MDNLYYVMVENVVAEANNFAFALLLATFNAFNEEQPIKLEATFLFFQKFIFLSDMSKVLTLMSNLKTNQIAKINRGF